AGLEAREPRAAAALRRLVAGLRCPVLTTYKAKGVIASDDPHYVGIVTSGAAEGECLRAADLLVLYGLDPIEFISRPWRYPLPALDLASGSSVRRNVTFDAARLADPSRAGVVVYVQNVREDSATFKFKEVLQSATWRPGQSGPTHQVSKAVLLEMYSATWCAACVYGDAAADYLANEFGVLSGKVESGRFEYLRPGAPWLLGLGAVAAVAFTWVARGPRRAGPRPPEGHA
ncbi:MAG: hypothetical protein HYT80_10315, partial [Euryarchaeota archaeon]|nr:hypothetical protein [Euryarchaeota archaeon]